MLVRVHIQIVVTPSVPFSDVLVGLGCMACDERHVTFVNQWCHRKFCQGGGVFMMCKAESNH